MNTRSCVTLLRLSRNGFRLCESRVALSSTGAPNPPHVSPHSFGRCRRFYSSGVKVRSYLQFVKNKIKPPSGPPYNHVCQVGEPVLRSQAAAVDPAAISGPEIQRVINTLVKVMRKSDCVGLSAPQIGVPLRILVLEYPEKMLEESSPASRQVRGLSAQPLQIFINPHLRILDGQTVYFREACESIAGFSASVPRYLSVEVTGLNEKGENVTWQASGWSARILQHEMDHLNGVLYIDHMDSKTFVNINWQSYNG
ncbi:peptide deformylase, mitochondrial [Antennarius striatus]|uniref:peptide deformylase, mitochondrial n=1 Tax=Antennarius striatus TaxID=241820 RepID=UPI0035B21BED